MCEIAKEISTYECLMYLLTEMSEQIQTALKCMQCLLVGTNRMLFMLIREKTKRMSFMVPLEDLDTRNMVRIASCVVKPKVSSVALNATTGSRAPARYIPHPVGKASYPARSPTHWTAALINLVDLTSLAVCRILQISQSHPAPHINLGALHTLLITKLASYIPYWGSFYLTCNPIWPSIACRVLLSLHQSYVLTCHM